MEEIIRLYLKWENTQIPLKDYLTFNDEELIKRFISSEYGKKALNLFSVNQRSELLKAFYAYIDDKWALGMLADKVDEVIEGFEKSL